MMKNAAFTTLLLLAAGPASAQLALPPLGDTLRQAGGMLDQGLEPVRTLTRSASELASIRVERLADFVRRNRENVEFDDLGEPARSGEAILLDPDLSAIETARAHGYVLIEQAEIDGLDVGYARLAMPEGRNLASGLKRLRKLLPGRTVTADQLHFASGTAGSARTRAASTASASLPRGGTVGVIDGGIAASPLVASRRGFAKGAPGQSDHATAIASLLASAGVERIWNADVYGSDPAGGGAMAIARALGWMAKEEVPVVSISLVGPANPLLKRAIVAARSKDIIVVAAVGNDGRAAPPAYPASYSGVVAVTGVDGKGRVMIEAGKALHLDYAAPGADLTAVAADGKRVKLRGTSFAAPLAAARIAAHRKAGSSGRTLISAVDGEAVDLGRKGPDDRYGRGLLCAGCRKGI